jgi:hypothetical protein
MHKSFRKPRKFSDRGRPRPRSALVAAMPR